ncbi:MAG: sensor histidine kinase [Acidimicrobiales bacterium]
MLSAIVGVVATSATVAALLADTRHTRDAVTEERLDELAAKTELEVANRLVALRALRVLIESDPDFAEDGFHRFAAEVFETEGASGLFALVWATTPTGQLDDLEITYFHPDPEGIVGRPLTIDDERAEARRVFLDRAIVMSRPTVAGAFRDPSITISDDDELLLPISLAAFDGDRVIGLISAVFVADQVVADVAPDRRFRVVDAGRPGAGGDRLLGGSAGSDAAVRRIDVLGRTWEIGLDSAELPSGLPRLAIVAGVLGLLLTGLVVTIVAQQARAHAAAEERAERLSGVARETADRLQLADERLREGLRTAQIELWERDYEDSSGWSSGTWAEDAVGMFTEFSERVHPDEKYLLSQPDQRDLGDIAEVEFRFLDDSGTYRWMLARSVVIERNGRRMIIGVQMDVDERHEILLELERVNTLLKKSNDSLVEFTRVASHDLRSPMHTIRALCRSIRDEADGDLPAGIERHLAGIEERVDRQMQLLTDLLTYANSDEDAAHHDVDVRSLVERIVADFDTPDGPTMTVDVDFPDVIRLEQLPFSTCVRNLVDNAVKHHDDPTNGTVSVTGQMVGSTIEVAVVDDGPGIERRYQNEIFEPFQRLGRATRGSGVGLSVVRNTAEHFGATIDVRSEPGVGAEFRIYWPAQIVLRSLDEVERHEERNPARSSGVRPR